MVKSYHVALFECGIRYIEMMDESCFPAAEPLRIFAIQFCQGCIEGLPVPKLCRWLGYIQGVLVERNMTTVEEERNWTRPLFRPLDFPEEN